jgi:hypothetical protein
VNAVSYYNEKLSKNNEKASLIVRRFLPRRVYHLLLIVLDRQDGQSAIRAIPKG